MTRGELVGGFAHFIATEEGFFDPGSIPATHHNPGDLLTWGDWPVVNGYVAFDNDANGWAALTHQIEKNISRGLTFRTFFAGQRDSKGKLLPQGYPGFCPAPVAGDRLTKGNDPATYASKAVAWINHKLGAAATVDTVIASMVES